MKKLLTRLPIAVFLFMATSTRALDAPVVLSLGTGSLIGGMVCMPLHLKNTIPVCALGGSIVDTDLEFGAPHLDCHGRAAGYSACILTHGKYSPAGTNRFILVDWTPPAGQRIDPGDADIGVVCFQDLEPECQGGTHPLRFARIEIIDCN